MTVEAKWAVRAMPVCEASLSRGDLAHPPLIDLGVVERVRLE
jgi:hypothetical protein|tara:strand:+ start:198 stop:323 length:126 start_codon:yes stop_codon:yes gene_type:complete